MEVGAADKSSIEEGDLSLFVGLTPDGVLDFVNSITEFSPVNVLYSPFCLAAADGLVVDFGCDLDGDGYMVRATNAVH